MRTQPQHFPTWRQLAGACSLDAGEIAAAVDRLAAGIECDHLLRLWAVTRLASKLDLTAALSPSTNPVTVVEDLGAAWAEEFVRGLDENPTKVAALLRAAQAVVERIVEEVRRRGLAG